jgi:hypothetical protein
MIIVETFEGARPARSPSPTRIRIDTVASRSIARSMPPPLRVWTNRGASTARWIDAELSATP